MKNHTKTDKKHKNINKTDKKHKNRIEAEKDHKTEKKDKIHKTEKDKIHKDIIKTKKEDKIQKYFEKQKIAKDIAKCSKSLKIKIFHILSNYDVDYSETSCGFLFHTDSEEILNGIRIFLEKNKALCQ